MSSLADRAVSSTGVPLASASSSSVAAAAAAAAVASSRPSATTATFQDAMLTVADEEKAAYLEAMEKVPELVKRESDPARFLDRERNDPWKAAKRLACYWKQRKDIFGADRAFLPLHQTGGGALNEQDLEALNTGAFVLLPNDSKGRTVVGMDTTRYLPAHSFPHYFLSKLRLMFYVLSIAAENKTSQKTGFVLISLLATAPQTDLSRRSIALVHDAFPIWTMETHFVFLPSRVVYGSFIDKIIEHTFGLLNYFAPNAFVHRGKSDEEVLRKLKTQGFSKRVIPEWMGGSWTMENFDNWKKRRARMEQSLLLSEEDKLQRKRQANALHSRQKRARQKSQVAMLEEECTTLRVNNEKLVAENQQLEEQLEYARSEAAILEYLEQQQQQQQAQTFVTPTTESTSAGQYGMPTDDASLWKLFDSGF